jgi:hypothetical protein
MDYPGVDPASFARNAGFGDRPLSLDVRFLKHPEVSRYLELFRYRYPEGDQSIHRRKTNDLGGIRHGARRPRTGHARSSSRSRAIR